MRSFLDEYNYDIYGYGLDYDYENVIELLTSTSRIKYLQDMMDEIESDYHSEYFSDYISDYIYCNDVSKEDLDNLMEKLEKESWETFTQDNVMPSSYIVNLMLEALRLNNIEAIADDDVLRHTDVNLNVTGTIIINPRGIKPLFKCFLGENRIVSFGNVYFWFLWEGYLYD